MTDQAGIISYFALAIVMIALFYIWAWDHRRKRARNCPEPGTFQADLQKVNSRIEAIEHEIENVEGRLEQTASRDDLEEVMKITRDNRTAIDNVARAIPDMEARQRALSAQIGDLDKRVAVAGTSIDHVVKQVDRLYSVLVPKGMEK